MDFFVPGTRCKNGRFYPGPAISRRASVRVIMDAGSGEAGDVPSKSKNGDSIPRSSGVIQKIDRGKFFCQKTKSGAVWCKARIRSKSGLEWKSTPKTYACKFLPKSNRWSLCCAKFSFFRNIFRFFRSVSLFLVLKELDEKKYFF